MSISAAISIILYYLVFLLYYRWLLSSDRKRLCMVVPALILIVGSYYVVQLLGLLWLNLPVLMLAMTVGIRLSSDLSFLQALYGAGVCSLSLYCFRGVTTAIGSWIVQDTIPGFALDSQSYYTLTTFSVIIALVFFQIMRRTIIPDHDLRMFMDNPASLKNVIVYEIAALPSFIILNQGRYYGPDALWFTGITLSGSAFIIIMLIYSIYHSIKETRLLQHKLNSQFLAEQLEIQRRYYNSYHKSTEKFRRLRHDYFSVMRTLGTLLKAGEKEQALLVVQEAYRTMEETKTVKREYSDSATLNAVLQDLAFKCEEHGIRLSCQMVAPRHTELTLLESLRIITNVTANAVEACKKVPKEERFIQITAQNEKGWAMLDVVNAFDGNILLEKGWLKSTKKKKEEHGMGLSIVKEIAESKGGLVVFDVDLGRKTFEARVCVPQCLPQKDGE